MKESATVLIVDDEPNAIRVLSAILKAEGYTVLEALGVEKAIDFVQHKTVDAIITDIKMPQYDGYHLFDYMNEHAPHVPVIFLTAYGTVDAAVQAISNGAFYYFVKPPDYQKLKMVLAKAVEQRKPSLYTLSPQNESAAPHSPRLIGQDPVMAKILRKIATIKDAECSVFICGETGTGKEIVANHLHYFSNRSDKPFVAVNCAAIPRELLEAELFGYEKGAFTGASGSRAGKLEDAAGGSLFLDEIGEMEPSLQAKLLRVLQERTINRLGSNKSIKVDFRLISSTNRNLEKEMESGVFRKDLYYRINVVRIDLPPLRDRIDDLPILASEFMNEFNSRESKKLTISRDAMDLFLQYSWPGNVRQLRNVIEHAVVICSGTTIGVRDLPDDLRGISGRNGPKDMIKSLRSLELQAIENALSKCNGNKSMAARQLGISRKALYARLKDA
jgi:DNA-binding NtrC family response regulator